MNLLGIYTIFRQSAQCHFEPKRTFFEFLCRFSQIRLSVRPTTVSESAFQDPAAEAGQELPAAAGTAEPAGSKAEEWSAEPAGSKAEEWSAELETCPNSGFEKHD